MRAEIIGPKAAIERFGALLEQGGIEVTRSVPERDQSDLAFGLGDLANLVTVIAFGLQLLGYLVAYARSLQKDETATIRLRSSFGMVTIELNRDIHPDELERLLRQLDPPRP